MTGGGNQALTDVGELADSIAAAVTRLPAVAGLAQVSGVPVATYLPGRTVSGVAVRADEIEICVVAWYGESLPEVAEQIRQAVEPLAPDRRVDVLIADLTSPDEGREAGSAGGSEASSEAAMASPSASASRSASRSGSASASGSASGSASAGRRRA